MFAVDENSGLTNLLGTSGIKYNEMQCSNDFKKKKNYKFYLILLLGLLEEKKYLKEIWYFLKILFS